ncbi:carbamoyltransferase N-terminal domain-containing protein [Micromonospora sp. NPDC051196]|uniref:carbamoyltransferase N-terminal domain-containing protein n=1 Tax=Micromonospora sp. NPDC051196 TaxID=3155281 RepID=UPI003416E9E9
MLICGVKVTHDGGVALVDGNRLTFSTEMEKLDNNLRHARIEDLNVIDRLVRQAGYDPTAINHLVLDGWRKTTKAKTWGGQELPILLAPYRRGIRDADLLRPYPFNTLDIQYLSYPHYAGHVASAYCTSPFAQRGADSYVLCWDGAMFPYLYHFEAGNFRRARSLGPLFYLLGDAYHTLAQQFAPFDAPIEWPHTLALPGKIMAFVAYGEPQESAVRTLADAYEGAVTRVFGPDGPAGDEQINEAAGRLILQLLSNRTVLPGTSAEDALASVHAFVGDLLVRSLVAAVERDGRRSGNLCLVGGCALNIKWNSAIRRSGVADEVWVPPFPNDAGSAIGAACCALLTFADDPYLRWSPYAGPALNQAPILPGWTSVPCSVEELAAVLHSSGAPVVYLDGRAELGPRALGHRSILAPAVSAGMRDVLNEVKGREGYRPVAPMCLVERAGEVFDPGIPDPFMLFDHDVRPQWRDRVPAICHVDGSARLQTVSVKDEPRLHALLSAYESLSGVPLLCNTSANLSGRGFFPDVRSAMQWGKIPRIWSDGVLYSCEDS